MNAQAESQRSERNDLLVLRIILVLGALALVGGWFYTGMPPVGQYLAGILLKACEGLAAIKG